MSSLAEPNSVTNNQLGNIPDGQAFYQIALSLFKTMRNVKRLWLFADCKWSAAHTNFQWQAILEEKIAVLLLLIQLFKLFKEI